MRLPPAPTKANSMYPACEIDEYASSRLKLRCLIAVMFPNQIDSRDSTATVATVAASRPAPPNTPHESEDHRRP